MTFPEKTARKIYEALMFEEVDSLSEELQEAFNEILNMVIGNIKATLTKEKIEFDDPMVAAGHKVKFENIDKVKWLVIPMTFKEWGNFNLFIGVK
jgi:CheY-specific phosphatase CheX